MGERVTDIARMLHQAHELPFGIEDNAHLAAGTFRVHGVLLDRIFVVGLAMR